MEGHCPRDEEPGLGPGPGCSHPGKWEVEQSSGAGRECGRDMGYGLLALLFSEDL